MILAEGLNEIEQALRIAIGIAKAGESETVHPDNLLLGCLWSISRFGVAILEPWAIDLEPFGVDWRENLQITEARPGYSDELVAVLDRAAVLAKRDGARLGIPHVLACYSAIDHGVMGELKRLYGITGASWRAALAKVQPSTTPVAPGPVSQGPVARPFFTPEEAAGYLGIHIQTLRGYIRSGKLPALRIAGERAIRLRREDLDALLEPLQAQEI